MSLYTPFRYDFVGSFLRPESLKQARADFEAKKITMDRLKQVEDQAITDLIFKIKSLGYHVITDGEFRRSTWHLDFMWGFHGIEHRKTEDGNTTFEGEPAMIDDTLLVDKLYVDQHPFVEHFKFVKQFEDSATVAKQTIPSPGQMYAFFTGAEQLAHTLTIYKSKDEFAEDIIRGYQKVIRELYDAGCRNVQFDDCVWGGLVNKKIALALTGETEQTLPALIDRLVYINNSVIADKPDDLVVNTHVCRGNYHSTFFSSGAYDAIAEPLFGREHVNAYYLEYDDERSGSFGALKHVTDSKKVVLGLITTKRPQLEDKDAVIARIRQAEQYIPLDRLYLSPQCGFASCEIGNKLTEEEQWKKLALVREIAEEVWGKER